MSRDNLTITRRQLARILEDMPLIGYLVTESGSTFKVRYPSAAADDIFEAAMRAPMHGQPGHEEDPGTCSLCHAEEFGFGWWLGPDHKRYAGPR